MNLSAWIEDLAAAYRIRLSEMTTKRYLKSVEIWQLTPEQLEQLSDRAVLRYRRLPSIAELYRIARELWEEAEIKANTEYLDRMHEEWKQQCASEGSAT